jgi:alanine-synthesizing transaminase
MFSNRLDWNLPPNEISALLDAKRRDGVAILDLTESNPNRAGIRLPDQEVLQPLSSTDSLQYEPCAAGLARARQAVADYYSAAGLQVHPDRIVLTASTSEAYSFLFKLLMNPGDNVLVPRPSYPLFEHLAALESVKVDPYSLRYQEGWWIDMETIRRRARAIVVVNPNNPTGSYLKKSEWHRLAAICHANQIALISDEVFSDYSFAPDPDRVPSVAANQEILSFALGGLSKLVGLPQMKLGWILVSGPRQQEALDRLHWIADTYLSVSAPVQHAAAHWLSLRSGFQARLIERLDHNLALARASCEVLDLEGGWYATLRLPCTLSDQQWAINLLREDNVLVQPGYFYDFQQDSLLVVSLLTPPEVFAEGIHRIRERADAA